MGKKNISTWLDNTKVRTNLYKTSQAVRAVYNLACCHDRLIIPAHMDAIKNEKLFKSSAFILNEQPLEFMRSTAFDPQNLSWALRDKCVDLREQDDEYILYKDKDYRKIGVKLNDSQVAEFGKYGGLRLPEIFGDNRVTSTLTQDQIDKIKSYEVIKIDLGVIHGREVFLTAAKELFPFCSDAMEIYIDTIPDPNNSALCKIMITTDTLLFKFYNIVTIFIQ